jgi:hypothetical protein
LGIPELKKPSGCGRADSELELMVAGPLTDFVNITIFLDLSFPDFKEEVVLILSMAI